MSNFTTRTVNMPEDALEQWLILAKQFKFSRRIGGEYTLSWYQLYTKLNFYYHAINQIDLVYPPKKENCTILGIDNYSFSADSLMQSLIFQAPAPVQDNAYIFFYISAELSPGVMVTKQYHLFQALKYDRVVLVNLQPYNYRRTSSLLQKNKKLLLYIILANGLSGWSSDKFFSSVIIQ